jgi:sterol 3beta-glucosyltransferase
LIRPVLANFRVPAFDVSTDGRRSHQVGVNVQRQNRIDVKPIRAVITNFGTMGDIRPLFSLGQELASAGHSTLHLVPPSAITLGKNMGQDCQAVGPDLLAIQNEINLALSTSKSLYASGEGMLKVLSPLESHFPAVLEHLKRECQNADVLICGPAQPLGKIVHEITGIPFVSIQFSNFGGNGGAGISRAGDVLINSFRRSIGLPSIENPLTTGANSEQLSLYAMSRRVFAKPKHWQRHVHVTGFFFERADIWHEDEQLVSFVSEPNRSIAITFGSMVHQDNFRLCDMIKEAVSQCGLNAVVQGIGYLQGPDPALPIYWTSYVPHRWLFQNVACVVHHGGGGTTGAVFRSGVPGIFVPHGVSFDQHYWSQFACDAGCAVSPVPFDQLTSQSLANSIRDTLKSSSIRRAADDLGRQIRSENGVRVARELIEKLVSNAGFF